MHVYQQTTAEPGAKTEVVWLGSGQQINQVNVSDILILSSSVKVVESARDLGVIIDSQSLSSRCCALPVCILPLETAMTLTTLSVTQSLPTEATAPLAYLPLGHAPPPASFNLRKKLA